MPDACWVKSDKTNLEWLWCAGCLETTTLLFRGLDCLIHAAVSRSREALQDQPQAALADATKGHLGCKWDAGG